MSNQRSKHHPLFANIWQYIASQADIIMIAFHLILLDIISITVYGGLSNHTYFFQAVGISVYFIVPFLYKMIFSFQPILI